MLFNGKTSERGFTLVELLIVVAILGVLAAVVIPTFTGVTSQSRASSQTTDINSVQAAVDRFNADAESSWPSEANLDVPALWDAGEVPTEDKTGAGTSGDPYVFDHDTIAGVDWTAVTGTKTFNPDYIRTKPKHADETITVADTASSAVFEIKKNNETVYVQLTNTSGGSLNLPTWGIDKDGSVWVFVNGESY